MRNNLLRPLLIIEFLIAVQTLFAFWGQVGGQYHLDLMYWPWKMGITLLSALLIVAITSCVARAESSLPRRIWVYFALLVLTFAVAGVVTYYYHVNEPPDEEQDPQQNQPARALLRPTSPDPAGILAAHHGLTGFAAEGSLELRHI